MAPLLNCEYPLILNPEWESILNANFIFHIWTGELNTTLLWTHELNSHYDQGKEKNKYFFSWFHEIDALVSVDKHITSMKVDRLHFATGEITPMPATWHVTADMTQIYPELKASTLLR